MRSGSGGFGGSSSSSSSSYRSSSGSGYGPFDWLLDHSFFFRALFVGFIVVAVVGSGLALTWWGMNPSSNIRVQPQENLIYRYRLSQATLTVEGEGLEFYLLDEVPDSYVAGYQGKDNYSTTIGGSGYDYYTRFYTEGSVIKIHYSFVSSVELLVFQGEGDFDKWINSEGSKSGKADYHEESTGNSVSYEVTSNDDYYFVFFNEKTQSVSGEIVFEHDATKYDLQGLQSVGSQIYNEKIGNSLILLVYNPSFNESRNMVLSKNQPRLLEYTFLTIFGIFGLGWAVALLWGLYVDLFDLVTYIYFKHKGKNIENYEIDVRYIKGIGKKRAKQLSELEIYTLRDLSLANVPQLREIGIPRKLAIRSIQEAREMTGHDETDQESPKAKE